MRADHHHQLQLKVVAAAVVALLLALPACAQAIVGGRAATKPYAHMAAMVQSDGQWRGCGGSLVRPDWILTAAHCVARDQPADLQWRVGTHDLDQPGGEVLPTAEIIAHERYLDADKPTPNSFDVALVRLARPATAGTPIAIAAPSERALWAPGATATVIGWGTQLPATYTPSATLQEVDVPMVADDTCSTFYPGIKGKFESETMVCAGYAYGTKDSCQGDSGGPLTVPRATGELVQVGVVSWGNFCALPTQYGVYARVADTPLASWIASKLPA